MERSLSIVIPALNEERALPGAVSTARQALEDVIDDYEIIVINDGSSDRTGEIAEGLAARDARIRVVHHDRPHNLGACYREALGIARKRYFTIVFGHDGVPARSYREVYRRIGEADIIIPYFTNMVETRSRTRVLLSRAFRAVVCLLFGLRVRYFNGHVVHRTDLLRRVSLRTSGYAYQAEILVQMLRGGHGFVEVGVPMCSRPGKRTKAFRLPNLWSTLEMLGSLAWRTHALDRSNRTHLMERRVSGELSSSTAARRDDTGAHSARLRHPFPDGNGHDPALAQCVSRRSPIAAGPTALA